MAQTNFTPIQLYYSTTAAAIPTAGNLLDGELAINITDGKLYYKNNAGVVTLFGSSGDLTSISFGSTGLTPSTATGGAVTVAGTLVTANGGTGLTSFTSGGAVYATSSSALTTGTLPTTAGGTGLASFTAGDLAYYATGTAFTKLAIGTANQILTSSGTAPQWSSSLTVTGLTDSGNLNFTGTGNRITGDFSNATQANRIAFQSSTTNGNTSVNAIPNGTATSSQFIAFAGTDMDNASRAGLNTTSTVATFFADKTGTGTYLPMTFYTGGSERVRIDINGLTGFGTASATSMLQTAGSSSVSAFKTPNIAEVDTISATAATGTINYDVTTQSVLFYTSNASGNWTVNFRGSSGTTLNTLMQTGESISATFLVTQGSTAYYNSAVTIDGTSVTPKWQGGSAPTSGNANSVDCYTYVIQKTGSATYAVLASQTKFA